MGYNILPTQTCFQNPFPFIRTLKLPAFYRLETNGFMSKAPMTAFPVERSKRRPASETEASEANAGWGEGCGRSSSKQGWWCCYLISFGLVTVWPPSYPFIFDHLEVEKLHLYPIVAAHLVRPSMRLMHLMYPFQAFDSKTHPFETRSLFEPLGRPAHEVPAIRDDWNFRASGQTTKSKTSRVEMWV